MGRIVTNIRITNLNEVLFLDMKPVNGGYEALIGYIILEQSQAAVDTLGHRLIHVKKADLKSRFCQDYGFLIVQ